MAFPLKQVVCLRCKKKHMARRKNAYCPECVKARAKEQIKIKQKTVVKNDVTLEMLKIYEDRLKEKYLLDYDLESWVEHYFEKLGV